MKSLSLMLCLLLFLSTANGQDNGTLTGRVVDENSANEEGIATVIVSIKNANLTTKTDADGHYTLTEVPLGDAKVHFHRKNYLCGSNPREIEVKAGDNPLGNTYMWKRDDVDYAGVAKRMLERSNSNKTILFQDWVGRLSAGMPPESLWHLARDLNEEDRTVSEVFPIAKYLEFEKGAIVDARKDFEELLAGKIELAPFDAKNTSDQIKNLILSDMIFAQLYSPTLSRQDRSTLYGVLRDQWSTAPANAYLKVGASSPKEVKVILEIQNRRY